ncbi:MAG: type II toxin-antitoxin system VapC family toxin [Candidatus Sericytochromatia bacterium]|nr:type II toxin-antitoxin system VapC family toxin [Candidatus Tanganyikabacteria bacterium]
MPTLFLESSALARDLVEGEAWLAGELPKYTTLATSALTGLEVGRALDRAIAAGQVDEATGSERRAVLDGLLARAEILGIDSEVMREAGRRFPKEPVRTLEAIHLASALIWSRSVEPPTVASCDRRVRENALALGMEVSPEAG